VLSWHHPHSHTYSDLHVYLYAHTNANIHLHVHFDAHTNAYTHLYIYLHAHTYSHPHFHANNNLHAYIHPHPVSYTNLLDLSSDAPKVIMRCKRWDGHRFGDFTCSIISCMDYQADRDGKQPAAIPITRFAPGARKSLPSTCDT
jgi:hypothetical protein